MPSKSTGRLVAANIVPPEDNVIEDQLEEIKKYFKADDSYYRCPWDRTKQIIATSTKFNQITAIDTPQERFGANITVTFKWQITKHDVVEYVAAPDQEAWEPAYTPPKFEVKNPASGDGA